MNLSRRLNRLCPVVACVVFFSPGILSFSFADLLPPDAVFAAGDREGWKHYKDEGSRYEVFGDFAKAQKAYSKSLELAKPPLASIAERGEVMARLANALIWQQKFAEAEPYFNELLKLTPRLKSEGKRNEDFFTCLDSLSNAYFEKIKGTNRISAIQHSIRIIDTAFGDIHPDLSKELVALAYTYSALGMNREALNFAKRALSVAQREKSDKGQIHLWKTLALVGACKKSIGDWNGARDALEQSVSLMNKTVKRFSMTAAAAKAQLAIVYFHMHKKKESKDLFKEAEGLFVSKIYEFDKKSARDIGTSGPELLAFAQMYVAFGQYDKAEPVCRRSLLWTKMVFGPEDPNLINEYRLHGFVLSRLGRLKESQAQEAAALTLSRLYKGDLEG